MRKKNSEAWIIRSLDNVHAGLLLSTKMCRRCTNTHYVGTGPQLRLSRIHRSEPATQHTIWHAALGSLGRETRKKERERNRRSPGCHFSLCQLLASPTLSPPTITPWDVDASWGQLPTDTSSWAERQALTALVQTNDAGVGVAGLPSSLPACSPAARLCTALASPIRTRWGKKRYIKRDSFQPTTSFL